MKPTQKMVVTETTQRPILKFIKTYFLHISSDKNQ